MDYYRESELGKFVRVGLLAVAVLAASGWYLRRSAQQEVRIENPLPPAPAAPSGAAQAPDPDSLEGRIRRWTGPASSPQAPRPSPQ